MLENVQQLEIVSASTDVVEVLPIKTLSTLEDLNVPCNHEERLEWVRKSCERLFEKMREFETMVNIFEPNKA
ncbi:MAG: hypothetical protein K2W95_16805 [Candidatus Obscuribacterales bacterium]|nr:hypothetical protein [Candidatus Obscuribacterales bacterium]